jgi:hypothetical protein
MEKNVTEEKKADIAVSAVKEGVPAIVDSSKADAPIILSQAPAFSPSDAKPVVDKPSSVVAPPLAEKK